MPEPTKNRLLTVLGAAFGLATIVGTMIGAGILRSPGDMAERLPSAPLFFGVWVVAALYSFGGANALCELATMMPKSGGQYNFVRHALGPYPGFFVGWNDWISVAGSATGVAFVLGETWAALFPVLKGMERAIGAAFIVGFTTLMWRNVKTGAVSQYVTTSLKSLAFSVLIVGGFVYAARNGIATAPAVVAPSGLTLLAAFVVSLQGALYAFDGWNGAIYFTEEVRDPGRNIPRATFGGLGATTIVYLLLLVSFVIVIPLPALAGKELAAASVASLVFGSSGETVIRLVIVVSLPSYINATLPMASRVLYAMARDGMAPALATRVNAGGTPTTALFVSMVVALLFLVLPGINAVFAVLSFLFVASHVLSFWSVFVLRAREPGTPRPWRAWGHPLTTALMVFGSVSFLAGSIWSDPKNGLIAVALVAASYPMYYVISRST
ncbi:MAG TPA: APC family permease [Gemmatimonadaceae bacterium]|nr:APC family permease [Gemmatimonadaceae bacterium]